MKNKLQKQKIPAGMKLRHTLRGHEDMISELAWSPDGRTLVSGAFDNTICLWDVESGKLHRTLEGYTHPIYSIAWSPDGRTLASGSWDKTICLWDAESGKLYQTLEGHTDGVLSVAWSPNGRIIASGFADNAICLWDAGNGELYRKLEGHTHAVFSVAWSPDGKILASGSRDRTIRLWDAESGKLRRTLEGHDGAVLSIAWSPDGHIFASGARDKTIRLWDVDTGLMLSVLEGHTSNVNKVSFSSDGCFLASKSWDSTVRIWWCDALETVAIIDESASRAWLPKLAFHPKLPLLATLGEGDTVIRIWELDYDVLLGTEAVTPSAHYTNAKVVIVGDSGVGKTGLGLVLSDKKFVPTESTHGRHVWTFDSREIKVDDSRKETREILLWDLAGQPGYRIIHQLHLDEVAVALVVFDGRSETDPFGGVLHWNRALELAKRLKGKSGHKMKKILVAARTDRGGVGVSSERVQRMMKDMGFADYFITSAKEGWKITELAAEIHKSIVWDKMPKVSSPELFYNIKTFLIKEKEDGRLLSTAEDLYRAFQKDGNGDKEDLRAEFDACIGRVESQGLIRRLGFGGLVLLQPEMLDSYASCIVNKAKNEPDGMGCIQEAKARAGEFYIPEEERLQDKDQEKLLLISTVEDLLSHELALREDTDHGAHLVFPSQFTRENPELPDPEGRALIYSFEGPVLNIYTTLVVRLTHSGVFTMKEMWKNATLFTAAGGGGYGVWMKQIEDGKADLTLFFRDGVTDEICFQFEEYVGAHLKRKASCVKRRDIFTCSGCNETITDRQVRLRRQLDHSTLNCPICDTQINILSRAELLASLPLEPESKIQEMDRSADEQRDSAIAVSTIQGKIATCDFDVFLAHNSKDKHHVEEIAGELKRRGLNPWIDKEQVPPGRWFQDVIQDVIPKVKSAAIIIGPKGLGKWQALELRSFISQCVEKDIPVIPVLLPGVNEIPKKLIFHNELNPVRFFKEIGEKEALDNLQWGITGEKPGIASLRSQ